MLTGGAGGDALFGGAGADIFVLKSWTESAVFGAGRDVIKDFESGTDQIDLSAIDADYYTGGDQAFTVVGSFSGTAGELIIETVAGGYRVAGDVTGTGNPDFAIYVQGDAPTGGDFIL